MKILGIDTSTMSTTVGLFVDGEVLGEFTLRGQISHSEALVDMIDNIFEKMNFSIGDIDLFAVGIGPGSFTGLRIGISVAKTFAQVLNKEIVGVSSLKALVNNIDTREVVIPIIDARRNRVYRGIYIRKEDEILEIKKDELVDLDTLSQEISSYDKVIFIGDGVDTLKDTLMEKFSGKANFVSNNLNRVKGGSFCILGREEYEKGKRDSYYNLVPNYANESQAQREYDNENSNKKC